MFPIFQVVLSRCKSMPLLVTCDEKCRISSSSWTDTNRWWQCHLTSRWQWTFKWHYSTLGRLADNVALLQQLFKCFLKGWLKLNPSKFMLGHRQVLFFGLVIMVDRIQLDSWLLLAIVDILTTWIPRIWRASISCALLQVPNQVFFFFFRLFSFLCMHFFKRKSKEEEKLLKGSFLQLKIALVSPHADDSSCPSDCILTHLPKGWKHS